MLYGVVLCCVVLCSAVLCSGAVMCCTVQCCVVQCCAVLCCTALCCAVLCCAVPRCAVLYCTVPSCCSVACKHFVLPDDTINWSCTNNRIADSYTGINRQRMTWETIADVSPLIPRKNIQNSIPSTTNNFPSTLETKHTSIILINYTEHPFDKFVKFKVDVHHVR